MIPLNFFHLELMRTLDKKQSIDLFSLLTNKEKKRLKPGLKLLKQVNEVNERI